MQLLEEAEQRRRDREQRLFESLETHTPPSFQLKVSPHLHTLTPSHHHITHTLTQDDDITFDGVLYRKNELDEGGRRAAARSWKQYHTVLIGPLLNLYRDKRDVQSYLSACPPINVTHGLCEVAGDYVKRKHTLRLK